MPVKLADLQDRVCFNPQDLSCVFFSVKTLDDTREDVLPGTALCVVLCHVLHRIGFPIHRAIQIVNTYRAQIAMCIDKLYRDASTCKHIESLKPIMAFIEILDNRYIHVRLDEVKYLTLFDTDQMKHIEKPVTMPVTVFAVNLIALFLQTLLPLYCPHLLNAERTTAVLVPGI